MTVTILNSAVLAVSLGLMLAQLAVREKRAVHLLFAVFCGSLAMMMAKRLSAESLGPWQYLVGLGACATCNVYWLVARSLFRGPDAVRVVHVALAGGLGLLLMSHQGAQAMRAFGLWSGQTQPAMVAVQESITLLSSAVLVLAFAEAARGWRQAGTQDRRQRLLFMAGYGASVLLCTVADRALRSTGQVQWSSELLSAGCALVMLVLTQVLILQRAALAQTGAAAAPGPAPEVALPVAETTLPESEAAAAANAADHALAQALQQALQTERLYLKTELKVADLARHFDVSEYRISRAIRLGLGGRNFNQFVNGLRIRHACALLADADKHHWPVLVVGLESGFASVGPFTRAFKAEVGCTPGEYRQRQSTPTNALTALS